jgi:hypothetical protein
MRGSGAIVVERRLIDFVAFVNYDLLLGACQQSGNR